MVSWGCRPITPAGFHSSRVSFRLPGCALSDRCGEPSPCQVHRVQHSGSGVEQAGPSWPCSGFRSLQGGNVTTHSGLTRFWRNAALRLLQCEARMSELLANIISAYGREPDAVSLEKTRRYLETLRSAVRTDDLPAYGLAYLEQLHNPDPRYSGC